MWGEINVKVYEKPVVSVDAGMAEGVYAASGATGGVTAGEMTVVANWGGSGQVKFALDLSDINRENLIVNITFNLEVNSIWGAGSTGTCNGKVATVSWSSRIAGEHPELTVQVNGNVNELKILGISCQN